MQAALFSISDVIVYAATYSVAALVTYVMGEVPKVVVSLGWDNNLKV